MRFSIEQRFEGVEADAVARAYASPELYARFADGPKLARPEVIDHQSTGDVVRLAIRYRFIGDLAPAARAVLDPARLTWVEHTTHDLADRSTAFELRADHYADRFRCAGSTRVELTPRDAACRRVGSGDLKVRAPLVGSTVERTLIADLTAHLRDEVATVLAFLAADSGH